MISLTSRKPITLSKLVKGFILIFLIIMVLYPSASFKGATTGLLLWFHNVLPNLLPFIIVSNLIISLNIADKISGFFYPLLGRLFNVSKNGCYPIVLGFLSGIPMGAKATSDLVEKGKINQHEGNFLITMCNNASPMFIIGFIAISELKLPQIKYTLFLIIYISAIISAVVCRLIYRKVIRQSNKFDFVKAQEINVQDNMNTNPISFEILDNSILNGFEIITKIGGYIILFSIIAQIISAAGPNISFYKPFFMGIVEITTGINQICSSEIDINTKIVLVATLTSFGGLSGMAQTKSVLGSTRLSIGYYLFAKIVSAFITLLLTSIYVYLFIN
ncbi:MAG: transporter [Clostridiales bacterium]|nr:transporter [Clostridiales bacterium]